MGSSLLNLLIYDAYPLLTASLYPVTKPPVGRLKMIEPPYDHVPDVQEFGKKTNTKGPKAYFARLAFDRIARGEIIPNSLTYPVQTRTFGNGLTIIFMAGEIVVDYSLRLKKGLAPDKLRANAYSNTDLC